MEEGVGGEQDIKFAMMERVEYKITIGWNVMSFHKGTTNDPLIKPLIKRQIPFELTYIEHN